jgi:hypothetical protein
MLRNGSGSSLPTTDLLSKRRLAACCARDQSIRTQFRFTDHGRLGSDRWLLANQQFE